MTSEDLDRMEAEAKHAQREGEAAAACLNAYRTALRYQSARLVRLVAQIHEAKEQLSASE